jgi:hypothetical protein
MMIALQRLFSALSLIVWFGGFTFYTSTTVRLGSKVVGGLTQGYITQRVTDRLNIFAGVMAVGVLLDIVVRWQGMGIGLRLMRSVNWLVIVVGLIFSVILHIELDQLLQPTETLDITNLSHPDPKLFSPLHQRYQMVNTFIWMAALVEIVVLVICKREKALLRGKMS